MILIQASKFSFFRNRTKLTDQPCNFISNKHHFTLTSPQNEFTHYQQLFGWIQSFKFKIFQLNWLKPAGLSTRKFIHTFQKEEEKTFGYSTKQIVFSSHTILRCVGLQFYLSKNSPNLDNKFSIRLNYRSLDFFQTISIDVMLLF